MDLLRSAPPQQPESALRLPAEKRISLPSSKRLNTITEGSDTPTPPPIPRRSSKRNSTLYILNSDRPNLLRRFSPGSTTSGDTGKTAPPAYDWVPEPIAGDGDGNALGQDEKLERVRRGEGQDVRWRRGGWGRLALILGIVLLVITGLAVGLGVGLTRRKYRDDSAAGGGSGNGTPPSGAAPSAGTPQRFPLGQYSMVTALTSVQTNCTSNPATWRCYPYTVFDPNDSSTANSSLAFFNWVITNTSSTYATNTSSTTPDEGVPANLTISARNDLYSIAAFSDKSLTYISPSSNSSSARYTFSFTMSKLVVPSPPITKTSAECSFNETTFTGTLYLSAPRDYPSKNLADSTAVGGYEQWPYALKVTQSATAGHNVPKCYETVNGAVGTRITSDLVPQPESDECVCQYRNY